MGSGASSNTLVLLQGTGRASRVPTHSRVMCNDEVQSGIKIAAIKAMGNNSVFRVTSVTLELVSVSTYI